MDMKAQLEALREHAHTLEDTIEDLDYQIERAIHAIAAATDDVGHAIMVLTERQKTQAGFMFELGKATAQIEDLENRIREQDERGVERLVVQEWEAKTPAIQEDHLDWLRPVLDAPGSERQDTARDERHPRREAEERMLNEMHREDREPEDYLDWWKP